MLASWVAILRSLPCIRNLVPSCKHLTQVECSNGGKLDSGSLPATCTHVRKGRTSGSPHGVGRPHAENRGRFFSGPVNCPMATTLESSWVLKGKEFLENTWVGPVENSIPNYLSNRRRPCRRDHGSPPNRNHGTATVRNKERLGNFV